MRRIAAILMAGLSLAAGLAGCAGKDGRDGRDGSDGSGPAASAQAAAGYPRTITHDKGTTTLARKPQRVVALDNSLVEAVALLGRPVVGGIASYRDAKGFPPYLGAPVKDAKDLGPLDNPNLELLATLKPDLIVSATVRHDALYAKLSAIAPTVFVKTTGPIWKDNITLLGGALGEEDTAARQLADYTARAGRVGAAIKTRHGDPTVAVVRFVDGPTRVYLPRTFAGIVLADAGLSRPANQRDPEKFNLEISEEQIGQADADAIFVTTFSGGEDRRRRFEANPLWQRLTAVRTGHVYEVQDPMWMTSVSLYGAGVILDDLARAFGVDPAR